MSDSFHCCYMTDMGLVAGAMSDSFCCCMTDMGLVAGVMSDSFHCYCMTDMGLVAGECLTAVVVV